MSRQSSDELAADGTILNGFDYNIQVWVIGGNVHRCEHPQSMRAQGELCCNAWRYQGMDIKAVPGHEVRT